MDIQKYTEKRDAVVRLADMLGVEIEGIVDAYPDEEYAGRLNRTLADQAFSLELTPEVEAILDNAGNVEYARDSRTNVEYAIDLIYGWVMEDIVFAYLETNGFAVSKTGADSDRQFLTSTQITTQADFEIESSGGQVKKYDVYFDSQNRWVMSDSMDVRESKWTELQNNLGAILCFSESGCALVDTLVESNINVWENPAWGFKRAVSIINMRSRMTHPEQFAELLRSHLR